MFNIMNPRFSFIKSSICVSLKKGVVDVAKFLVDNGFILIATPGTGDILRVANVPFVATAEIVGSEIYSLQGRLKTIYHELHAGILYCRDNLQEVEEVAQHNIPNIEIVICNLYAFEEVVALQAPLKVCLRNIDNGGTSLIRSAAKNHEYVTVVTSSKQYARLISDMELNAMSTSSELRKIFAVAALSSLSGYAASIVNYFATQANQTRTGGVFRLLQRNYRRDDNQKYLFYQSYMTPPIEVLHGSPTSENVRDAIHGWQLTRDIATAMPSKVLITCTSFKNSCALSCALSLPLTKFESIAFGVANLFGMSMASKAVIRSRKNDPLATIDDFIALSHTVDLSTAILLTKEGNFKGIIAPNFEREALVRLKGKHTEYILIKVNPNYIPPKVEFRETSGVVLRYEHTLQPFPTILSNVTSIVPAVPNEVVLDVIIAYYTACHTTSNAMVVAKGGKTVAVTSSEQAGVFLLQSIVTKLENWWYGLHPKVTALRFHSDIPPLLSKALQVHYIQGTLSRFAGVEKYCIGAIPESLTKEEKEEHMSRLKDNVLAASEGVLNVATIKTLVKYGVQYVLFKPTENSAHVPSSSSNNLQDVNSDADKYSYDELKEVCDYYGVVMIVVE